MALEVDLVDWQRRQGYPPSFFVPGQRMNGCKYSVSTYSKNMFNTVHTPIWQIKKDQV